VEGSHHPATSADDSGSGHAGTRDSDRLAHSERDGSTSIGELGWFNAKAQRRKGEKSLTAW
jgi:hypothetical protein